MDGSPPGSPVPGILQARTLEWVAITFSNAWKWKVKVKSLSHIRPSATPWTAAFQAPPSMGFSRQEDWSGVPLHIVISQVYFYGSLFLLLAQVFSQSLCLFTHLLFILSLICLHCHLFALASVTLLLVYNHLLYNDFLTGFLISSSEPWDKSIFLKHSTSQIYPLFKVLKGLALHIK